MPNFPLFHDRHDAGHQLAQAVLVEMANLSATQSGVKPIVYALPKGGLPIAEPLAQLLHCPLDVVVAKKITRPENPELAIGAVTADGHVIRSRQECFMQLNNGTWRTALQQAQTKAQAQLAQFKDLRPLVDAQGAIAILVDDGIATGMTMAVAARALRAKRPAQILICAPVAPKHMVHTLGHWGDRVIILASPESFFSVSRFYGEFHQVEMDEALESLKRGNQFAS
ncbi:MAG: phosphoribosyltransferase family protein [Oculatellaceae cyanobacterium bins.114]|nr:phosphoribosyltransferase family protein [Oculatellaceae cyanobacterium bins.114]